jgi:hypothetical protein
MNDECGRMNKTLRFLVFFLFILHPSAFILS